MKVLFASQYDVNDINSKSGVPYFTVRALERAGCEVQTVSPLNASPPVQRFFKLFLRVHNRLSSTRYLVDHSVLLARDFARKVEQSLRKSPEIDIVFSPCTMPVAFLRGTVPVVTYTDTTAAEIIDFYPEFSNLCWVSRRNLHKIEQRALDRARVSIFTNHWARNSAKQHYELKDSSQLEVCPRGAGFFGSPKTEEISEAINARQSGLCRILWIGSNWTRKGGPAAVELVCRLNEGGFPAELVVVGALPFGNEDVPAFVRQVGYLDKSDPDQYQQLIGFFKDCSFLAMPSQAECLSIATIEGFAYGLPCLAVDTGGMSDLVRNDETGFLYSAKDFVPFAVKTVQRFGAEAAQLAKMSLNCHHFFKDKLSWDAIGGALRRIIENRLRGV